MFGNAAAERKAIESTYDAVCGISRPAADYSDGIAQNVYTVIAEGVPCGLSRGGDSSSQDMANVIADSRVLFAAPETDIKAGDTVTVTLYGRTERFEAVGISLLYATHQEVTLQREEHA
jgi:hypothetical protein